MKIKKIGILTSGGDSPGMNAVINTVVKIGLANNCEMYFIYEGFKGLIYNNIEKIKKFDINNRIISKGGTILKSSRSEDFKKDIVRKKVALELKKQNINNLICAGGNGTYIGALSLSKFGINCICIPCTIDNDINSTDFTIGFDTCLNTILTCAERIIDTVESHQMCVIIEVMGRNCGDLALYAGIAINADVIITPKNKIKNEEIIKKIKELKDNNKKYAIIIICENIYSKEEIQLLMKALKNKTNFECRYEVIGRVQRGGSPSVFDRILATKFSIHAVNLILKNKKNMCVGIRNNKIIHLDIEKSFKIKNKKILSFLNI